MNIKLIPQEKIKKIKRLIIGTSILIPLVVVVLFGVKIPGLDFSFLPPIYATLNGITAVLLLGALIAVKSKKIKLHELLIKISLFLSLVFLACYVAYHMSSEPTPYGGDLKFLYFFILISHILLSVVVIPLVLFSYFFAWQGDFVRHKKWTRFTWPIWFYVATTGVIVYLMISPFYGE
jgi:putative membrane protein